VKTISVTSVLCYLTQVEGLTWRDQDYRAHKMIKIIKGEAINGYLDAGTKEKRIRYTAANQVDFIPHLVAAVANGLRPALQKGSVLVPIPNSSAVVGGKTPFATQILAEQVARAIGNEVRAEPVLRWKQAKTPAHKGGSRNPQVHLANLSVLRVPTGPLVLFDDVMTTGSQLVASYRALTAEGNEPQRAFVFGRAIKDQKASMIAWAEEQLEVEEAPLDWPEF